MNDIKNILNLISSILFALYLTLAIVNHVRAVRRSKKQNGNIK